MKAYQLNEIIKWEDSHVGNPNSVVSRLLTDSRTMISAADSIFFAITTKRNSGGRYVMELYEKGVRNFVVSAEEEDLFSKLRELNDVNVWLVKNVVNALQLVAANHRAQFHIPVIGVTGSNGKTIVKEWIGQLLSEGKRVVQNPKSFNSQIGVPLSVWQMSNEHEIAVFEAGISETGEMENLRTVINPTIGIFTNIGQAHDENFLTRSQKVAEKLLLFTHCEVLIYCSDHKEITNVLLAKDSFKELKHFTWGEKADNDVQLMEYTLEARKSVLTIRYRGEISKIEIPFIDMASRENAMHCICLMLYLGYEIREIASRCKHLVPIEMRMEIKEGINNCMIINDGYSLDLNSLAIALDFLKHERQHFNKTLIISDFFQTGLAEHELYHQVASLVKQRGVTRFIGIGDVLGRNKDEFQDLPCAFYSTTEEFLQDFDFNSFQSETILIKGARIFHFENIARVLQRKSHETIMEVNLTAMISNLNYYRQRIKPTTKLMAMVKAASYGAGKVEVASALQYNNVDYLTVAYCDEGVELRRNGITLPIMVMNPEEESFDNIIKYNLEPDIYSFRIFKSFSETASLFLQKGQKISVHIELDTGMHRLGFREKDLPELIRMLNDEKNVLEMKSIFSHFACSEDPEMDDFTRRQIEEFKRNSTMLKEGVGNPDVWCHICNSSGITRFPEAHMDMVRLGIGLYGISPEPDVQKQLTLVSRLRTRISQIKDIPEGESVGYNCRWIARRESKIAIIQIGYADGLNRKLGYENGYVIINGKKAPIIGSICMDMCFLDVTEIDCKEGDDVIIFGDAAHLTNLSNAQGTITYELMTSVSPRVKRVYYQE